MPRLNGHISKLLYIYELLGCQQKLETLQTPIPLKSLQQNAAQIHIFLRNLQQDPRFTDPEKNLII